MKNHERIIAVLAGVCFLGCGTFLTHAEEMSGTVRAELPLYLYRNCEDNADRPYFASGWMGNQGDLERDDCCKDRPYSGDSCIKIVYSGKGGWAGIVWQNPANDWGALPGGYDLGRAKKLVFWARAEKSGEIVEFKMGILGQNVDYPDSSGATLGKVALSAVWREYSIALDDKDLSRIKTGFAWFLGGGEDPITFYLDDIRYE